MAEIITNPKINKYGNAIFQEKCSISDLIRYAIKCSDLETVKYLVNNWENELQASNKPTFD